MIKTEYEINEQRTYEFIYSYINFNMKITNIINIKLMTVINWFKKNMSIKSEIGKSTMVQMA